MHVLVVGGAGYIGSHMVKLLVQRGFEVTVLDNLSAGHRDAVRGARFVLGDLFERDALEDLCREAHFDGVMHFASHIQVGESVREPAKYYRNNVFKTQNLLDVMVARRVRCFIFSSTAAIFGEPVRIPMDEEHPKQPINPYGRGKWMVEQMLEDYDTAYGLKSVCLRYFNAAGADPDGELGERHDPETHLIPLVLQAASGRRPHIAVFGNDYDTPDGTCIRDYIHVNDLCEAHLRGLQRLWEGGNSTAYNLGNGNGAFVDASSGIEATNPSLSQVTEWLDQVSTMLDLALATEWFVVPITDASAKKALDAIVNSLVSDLVNAANSSGRFFTERVLEGGRNPMLLIRSDILSWVSANADGLASYPDVVRNVPEGRSGAVASAQLARADTVFAQDEYSRPSYMIRP